MANTVNVNLSGPVFDGRADAASQRMVADIERDIAAQARSEVMTVLNASIKHPTPYYETQIRVRKTPTGQRVDDSGVVYGPWLESGAGRRTRFRGYHAFAKATAAIQAKAGALAQRVITRYIGGMR